MTVIMVRYNVTRNLVTQERRSFANGDPVTPQFVSPHFRRQSGQLNWTYRLRYEMKSCENACRPDLRTLPCHLAEGTVQRITPANQDFYPLLRSSSGSSSVNVCGVQ